MDNDRKKTSNEKVNGHTIVMHAEYNAKQSFGKDAKNRKSKL